METVPRHLDRSSAEKHSNGEVGMSVELSDSEKARGDFYRGIDIKVQEISDLLDFIDSLDKVDDSTDQILVLVKERESDLRQKYPDNLDKLNLRKKLSAELDKVVVEAEFLSEEYKNKPASRDFTEKADSILAEYRRLSGEVSQLTSETVFLESLLDTLDNLKKKAGEVDDLRDNRKAVLDIINEQFGGGVSDGDIVSVSYGNFEIVVKIKPDVFGREIGRGRAVHRSQTPLILMPEISEELQEMTDSPDDEVLDHEKFHNFTDGIFKDNKASMTARRLMLSASYLPILAKADKIRTEDLEKEVRGLIEEQDPMRLVNDLKPEFIAGMAETERRGVNKRTRAERRSFDLGYEFVMVAEGHFFGSAGSIVTQYDEALEGLRDSVGRIGAGENQEKMVDDKQEELWRQFIRTTDGILDGLNLAARLGLDAQKTVHSFFVLMDPVHYRHSTRYLSEHYGKDKVGLIFERYKFFRDFSFRLDELEQALIFLKEDYVSVDHDRELVRNSLKFFKKVRQGVADWMPVRAKVSQAG